MASLSFESLLRSLELKRKRQTESLRETNSQIDELKKLSK